MGSWGCVPGLSIVVIATKHDDSGTKVVRYNTLLQDKTPQTLLN